MPQSKLAELRRMVDGMTPGEWVQEVYKGVATRYVWVSGEVIDALASPHDAACLVAMHNNFTDLLEVCEAAAAYTKDRGHRQGCYPLKRGCTCGLDALRAALEKLGESRSAAKP